MPTPKKLNGEDIVTKPRKKRKKSHPLKKTLTVIGTTLMSLVLIVVITGSIVATALTVYVMKFMDDTSDIDLTSLELASTSFIYANDKDGNQIEIKRLNRNADRIIIKLDQVPQHVLDAFVYTEDERFYEHKGVDFKRTFAAFANMILHFWASEQGGSTITQQLVKNVTGDDDATPQRKIREIFQAMNLEKYNTKDDILEAYLNYIGFGGRVYGVQAASYKYFGKDVKDLTIAEGASLAAIPKSPNTLNPFAEPSKDYPKAGVVGNKERQEIVLSLMLKNAAISTEEYDAAVEEKLQFRDPAAPVVTPGGVTIAGGTQSWFVDTVINEVAAAFQKLYGLESLDAAIEKIYSGGYKIYSSVDLEMQAAVEAKYLDYKTFSSKILKSPPQSAFICMDYKGNIKAIVGGIGEKPGDLCWNIATMTPRSIGSCIKPISTYGLGMSLDLFHWSSIFIDTPIEVKDWQNNKMVKWPKNYSNVWTGSPYFTFQALQRSLNTTPAQLCELETPRAVFDFMQKNIGITSLVAQDIEFSPMTVGGLTNGITLEEMVSSYQAFGNLGKIYEPTSYYKVEDVDGKVILEHKYIARQALDPDSAYVLNKLLQTVIEGPNGTGRAAKLPNTTLIGKTGTSQEWVDLAFVGCTPNYVSGIWYGYEDAYIKNEKGETVPHSAQNTYYSSSVVWKNVFGDIANAAPHMEFPTNEAVEERKYCTISGLMPGTNCPQSTAVGYYKPSNIPAICDSFADHSGKGSIAPAITTPPTQTTTIPVAGTSGTTNTPGTASPTTPDGAATTFPPMDGN